VDELNHSRVLGRLGIRCWTPVPLVMKNALEAVAKLNRSHVGHPSVKLCIAWQIHGRKPLLDALLDLFAQTANVEVLGQRFDSRVSDVDGLAVDSAVQPRRVVGGQRAAWAQHTPRVWRVNGLYRSEVDGRTHVKTIHAVDVQLKKRHRRAHLHVRQRRTASLCGEVREPACDAIEGRGVGGTDHPKQNLKVVRLERERRALVAVPEAVCV
jgi:hypothetical protein